MTTTDPTTGRAPTTPPPGRLLRRSATDRIGAGVAGGLGEYFGVDPVLFRVLFATSAFFGGAGIIAYVLAWAAIPERGTEHAPIDRVVAELRHRRLSAAVAIIVAALLLYALAFSWWVPGPFFPVFVLIVVVVVLFGRRGPAAAPPATPTPPGVEPGEAPTVSLDKDAAAPAGPSWPTDTRQWLQESRAVSRERRRRAAPVRWATVGVLVVALAVLGLVDAATGIPLPLYAWATMVIVGVGLLVGFGLRRTPWVLALLLLPATLVALALGGTSASLHDGVGTRTWTPTTAGDIADGYRLAAGQATLDLRSLGRLDAPQDIDVVMAAGQVRLLLPATMNAVVEADVRCGAITVDGDVVGDNGNRGFGPTSDNNGFGVSHTVRPPAGATGPEVHIHVELADGEVRVDRS